MLIYTESKISKFFRISETRSVVRTRHVVKRPSKRSALVYKYMVIYIYTSAHTLARSLHDVSRANNNRFAVVVCFRLTFHSLGMPIFFGNFRVNIF